MKIAAFIGTARRHGDSYKAIKLLEERMNALGPAEFEYLFIEDLGLPYCRGCELCIKKDEGLCPHRAIVAGIERKMEEADGIILASPVYEHQVTALMKNFMDHLAYFYHRPRLIGKSAVVVAPTGGSGLKETLGYLEFTAVGWGLSLAGSLGIVSPLMKASQAYRLEKTKEIELISKRMVEVTGKTRTASPRLYDLIFFRSMRLKALGIEADCAYWEKRNWLAQDYFTRGRINPISNFLAAALEALFKISMSSMKGKYAQEET
jgi:multimeric flavodoxin WrbA